MNDITVLRDRLNITNGVVILNDSTPNGIHFTMNHAITPRSGFFNLINNNSWWLLSRKTTGKIKEYKVANYKPAW